MKKIFLILLATVLAISMVAVGCPEPIDGDKVPEQIDILAVRSVSGPLSVFEETAMGPIYKYWEHVVNDVKGGIYVAEYGKKLPVNIDVKDDTSDMDTMTTLLNTNLATGKYSFVIGPCCTPFLEAAGPICSLHGAVLVGAEGGCTSVAQEMNKYPYMFSNLGFSDWYQVPVLCELLDDWAATQGGAITVFVLSIDDLFGYEYTGQLEEFAADYTSIEILGILHHPPFSDASVVGPHVEQAAAAGADVLVLNTYPPTPFEAVGYALEQGIDFNAIVTGPAACYEGFYEAFGPFAEGICGYGAWNEYSSAALREFSEGMIDFHGRGIMDWWGGAYYYAGLEMLEKAIEEAGSLDAIEVREVLATKKLNTIMGETWYTDYNGNWPLGSSGGLLAIGAHPGEVGQYQRVTAANNWLPDGVTRAGRSKPYGIAAGADEWMVFEVIGPAGKATADWIYPKPTWAELAPP